MQSCKDWAEAATELTKWFRRNASEDDIPPSFHKELAEDIFKLRFSVSSSPIPDAAHRGITPLAFALLSVQEENLLRDNQDAYDLATTITPENAKAAKRKCPKLPETYDQFERLVRRYIHAGRALFGTQCPHIVEVIRIKQELQLMYRRNGGHLPRATIASLVWDFTTDAAQFFATFPTEEEFVMVPQQGMPQSQLAISRSLMSSNRYIAALDTPAAWVAAPIIPKYSNELGAVRTNRSLAGKRKDSDALGGTANQQGVASLQKKRPLEYNRNTDMHPALLALMKPVLDQNSKFRVGTIANLAGIETKDLPRHKDFCQRWMLGSCSAIEGDASKCKVRIGNSHPVASAIPNDYATKLAAALRPGIEKFLSEKRAKS